MISFVFKHSFSNIIQVSSLYLNNLKSADQEVTNESQPARVISVKLYTKLTNMVLSTFFFIKIKNLWLKIYTMRLTIL